MKKVLTLLLAALTQFGCATYDLAEFADIMTEEEKLRFLTPILIYNIDDSIKLASYETLSFDNGWECLVDNVTTI